MTNIIELFCRPSDEPLPISLPNPRVQRAPDLGPRQLDWLRRNVHGFAVGERQALSARKASDASRRGARA